MNDIQTIEPQIIWKHFYALTQIPRPSKFEKAAIEHIEKFAKELGLETVIDKPGNLIVRKAAQNSTSSKMVILQSHVDMVPQKNNDKVHDFKKDPIETFVDNGWLKAKGTTLGADNGLGCAAMMAVLESKDISHGPIEALFTMNEEAGMEG
ncbi:MAG: M20/M25/M40 family metallo-hydrolase, partial [Bacteroidales bacterium]|nr:M20/M25/M40 family metallo-hydrolase [Bacteroidales bacterium]